MHDEQPAASADFPTARRAEPAAPAPMFSRLAVLQARMMDALAPLVRDEDPATVAEALAGATTLSLMTLGDSPSDRAYQCGRFYGRLRQLMRFTE
jgi:hypothetical protein